MNLTSERCNGIKQGFWSAAKKDALVQRLGPIEHVAPALLGSICDHYCNRPDLAGTQAELDGMCLICPVTKLARLISGGGDT